MTDWERLWEIFHEARTRDPSSRASYLQQACGPDAELRREIEELLDAEVEAEDVLRTRALGADLPHKIAEEVPLEEYAPGANLAGRFRIVQRLGRGGMGTVYQAIELELERTVALKFLQMEDPRFTRRFQMEARFQARIDHPHICKVYEVGDIDGRRYISMQFISGKTLHEAAAAMTLPEKVRVLQQVCEALHAAHSLGVIHRDIKPTNILVTRRDTGEWIPYVTDFGLARELAAPGMTSTGMVMGTAWYMAPEQARGEIRKLDRRCDVHALGATLYEVLCGKPPFEGKTSVEILAKVLNEDPPPLSHHDPQIPDELDHIVQKCLQKDPANRYQTAAALAEDLGRFLRGEAVLARPVTWRHRAVKRIKRYPVISGLLAVAILAVTGLAGFAAWTSWRAQAQARLANEFEQEIRYMEETARHAYTQPLHNILHEEAIVEQRLKAIEQRINDTGSIAEGPGQFALGRGYMALYRYPEARTHLEQAYQQYRIPRVAFALGVTLALLYQKEFEKADRIADKNEREAKRLEIDKEFRTPALRYIEEGRSAVEAPEYVEGLIAYLDKRYEDALQKTATAFRRQPWFFEAKKLEGDILRAKANERKSTGDTHGAIGLYEKAETAYRDAVHEGASYALGYGCLCALGLDWTNLMMYQTGFPDEEVLRKSLDACDRSLQINPDRPEAYIAKAALKGSWGSYLMSRGKDPTSAFNESVESARAALKWEWVRFAAYTNMAVAYSRRAAYEMQAGLDAREALDQSIECGRQAVRLNPNSAPFRNNLGISLAIKAGYEVQHGRPAGTLPDEAIREFEEAVRIQPTFDLAYNNLGEIHLDKARAQYDQGRDPLVLLQASAKFLNKTIEINPTLFIVFITLGENYKLQARYGMENGRDPTGNVNQAVKSFRKALELNPKSVDACVGLAGACCLQAEFDLARKQDPAAQLATVREAIGKAEELAAGHPDLPRAKAEAELISASWKAERGGQAIPDIRRGLIHAGAALSMHPEDARLHATKGAFLLLQARLEKSTAARRKEAREAAVSFEKALELNSHLSSKYESSLKEARHLAGM